MAAATTSPRPQDREKRTNLGGWMERRYIQHEFIRNSKQQQQQAAQDNYNNIAPHPLRVHAPFRGAESRRGREGHMIPLEVEGAGMPRFVGFTRSVFQR
jgi:hypothetical protein